jgi:hypothetical protein
MTWIKKYIDPLRFSPWNILLIDSLEKWGGDNILLLVKKDFCIYFNILSGGFGRTVRIGNASDLITVMFPINVKSRQHQALSILLIL